MEEAVKALHRRLLDYWNRQDAKGMASLFTEDANVIGFDGSQLNSRAAIEKELSQVFSNHPTARYVWKVEEVRSLQPAVSLLRAKVGMVPPGKNALNPATNALQSLVAVEHSGQWQIALFQNTPAAFHGRPELVEAMTRELSELL